MTKDELEKIKAILKHAQAGRFFVGNEYLEKCLSHIAAQREEINRLKRLLDAYKENMERARAEMVSHIAAQNAEIAELKKEVARLIEINAFLSAGKIRLCREEIEEKDTRIAELEHEDKKYE